VSGFVTELLTFVVQRLRASPVTLTLMATCVALDWLCRRWGPGPWRDLVSWHLGEARWDSILNGEIHRLLASTFLHADGRHLSNNLRVLGVAGLILEPALGGQRLLLLYTVSALAGKLCYLATGLDYRILGASGAIMGLELALVGYRLRLGRPFPLGLREPAYAVVQLGALLGSPLAFAALARSPRVLGGAVMVGVAQQVTPPRNLGHLGGALVGLLVSYTLLFRPRSPAGDTPASAHVTALAALACAAVAGSIAVAIGAGRPWRLMEEPRLVAVRLQSTPFRVDIPELSVREALPMSGQALRFFSYGRPYSTPVRLDIGVSAERLAMTAEEFVEAEQIISGRRELADDELRRVVSRTRVGVLPALRTDSERQAGVETTLEWMVDGFCVHVSGYREGWATRSTPWVWEGIERRIAESVRTVER
jgi:rhomboid protease GluP